MTVGGAMAVRHTGQEGQGREKEEKSGSEDLQKTMNKREVGNYMTMRTYTR